MSGFELVALVLTATAVLAYVNERTLRLPIAIGVAAGGMSASLLIIAVANLGPWPGVQGWAEHLVERLNFDELVLRGMLGVLLFAGALHVDWSDLRRMRGPILLLATAGTILSTALVAGAVWGVSRLAGVHLPLLLALLFGALISPTDPLAVLHLLRRAGAPHDLEVVITGESLFNDGVGVVLFTMLLESAGSSGNLLAGVAGLFGREVLGGCALGLLLGGLTNWMLGRIDEPTPEILLTIALVTGGFALASALGTSGPLAMVVAGLMIGNHGREFAMSERTRGQLDTFWEVTDEVLNSALFLLIGLELLAVSVTPALWLLAAAAIPAALVARFISTGLPVSLWRERWGLGRYTIRTLTWGGLRGGIAIALALSFPAGPAREEVLAMTYAVVAFSILVQGLTVQRLARRAAA